MFRGNKGMALKNYPISIARHITYRWNIGKVTFILQSFISFDNQRLDREAFDQAIEKILVR